MSDIQFPAEFEWRIAKARAEMARAGCDLLILDSGESLAWLSGYTVSETMYRAVFLPREGSPWFVLRMLDAEPCRQGSWITDIVGYLDHENPMDVISREITDRGFSNKHIGLDLNSISMNSVRLAQLQSLMPDSHFHDLGSITESLRWVKSEYEIDLIDRSAAIADQTLSEIAARAHVGFTTREAAAFAASKFLKLGADNGETGPIVRGRGDHEFLHGLFHTEALEAGDILHVELIPRVMNYSARIMRPVVIGQPSQQQQHVAAELVRLQDLQIAAMKPGVLACDVDKIVRDGVLKAGLRPEYTNVSAYTLGLYVRTPRSSDFSRVFLPTENWPLQENMVFHVYTTAQGLGFSETVVVTPNGGHRLTKTPRKILTAETTAAL
ncbi:M24 family metallopeptidase [Brucellaceae bacterium C25G]